MQSIDIIPLFADIAPADGERYARNCFWKDYDEYELVIDVEDETTDVRFILSGSVRIIHRIAVGKEVILDEMSTGEFFGEISAIDSETRSANITTLTRTRICIMPQKIFMEILENDSIVNCKVLRVLTQRIRFLNLRLAEHSFLQAKHRLYSELMRLSKPRPGHEGQRSISPPPIQRELADRIGSRREVVSRELNSLEREGIINKTRGSLIIIEIG
ncbi:MAG: Crp/Fnr family transcriptional regulator, partial [Rhizobiaceae bacterium]|nr:Crp/Fnr family transcriptional regulator [Rhizobiaceae bacterium]